MFDDDYDDYGPPKEEPDCYACCDGRYVAPGRLARLLGRRDRRCQSCNPGRVAHWLFVLRWHPFVVALVPRRRYRGEMVDEPPF